MDKKNLIDVANTIRVELYRNVYNDSVYLERLAQLIRINPTYTVNVSLESKRVTISSTDKNFISGDCINMHSIFTEPMRQFIIERKNLFSSEIQDILDDFLSNPHNISMLYDLLSLKKQIIIQL